MHAVNALILVTAYYLVPNLLYNPKVFLLCLLGMVVDIFVILTVSVIYTANQRRCEFYQNIEDIICINDCNQCIYRSSESD